MSPKFDYARSYPVDYTVDFIIPISIFHSKLPVWVICRSSKDSDDNNFCFAHIPSEKCLKISNESSKRNSRISKKKFSFNF